MIHISYFSFMTSAIARYGHCRRISARNWAHCPELLLLAVQPCRVGRRTSPISPVTCPPFSSARLRHGLLPRSGGSKHDVGLPGDIHGIVRLRVHEIVRLRHQTPCPISACKMQARRRKSSIVRRRRHVVNSFSAQLLVCCVAAE